MGGGVVVIQSNQHDRPSVRPTLSSRGGVHSAVAQLRAGKPGALLPPSRHRPRDRPRHPPRPHRHPRQHQQVQNPQAVHANHQLRRLLLQTQLQELSDQSRSLTSALPQGTTGIGGSGPGVQTVMLHCCYQFCLLLRCCVQSTEMLMLRRVCPSLIPNIHAHLGLRYFQSNQAVPSVESLGLFDSKYHRNGPLELRRPKAIEKLLGEHRERLDHRMLEMEKQRSVLLVNGVEVPSSDDYHQIPPNPLLEEYLRRYAALSEVFRQCPLNSEWVYKAVGWYNVLPLYKPLVERLLLSSGEETQCLLVALSWMTFRWTGAYGMIDQDLRDRRKVEGFYRSLSPQLEIDHLRSIEQIIVAPLCLSKRKFYESYVSNNLDHFTKGMQSNDAAGIANLVWLFHRMVASMVDQEVLVLKFQKFLLTPGLQLGVETELLLRLYELKGRVNKLVYSQHLKPYLLRHKMKELGDIIETIRFVVCSECGDNALLKNLFELLEMNYQRGAIRHSRHLYDLHLYTHYLRLKGYTIKLPKELENQLNHFCRERAENRESLNRLVYDAHLPPAKGKGKAPPTPTHTHKPHKHVSECLNVNKSILSEYPATKRSAFETSFKYKLLHLQLDELKIYEKPVFCCFQLDFCLRKPTTNELLDIEVEGMQYVFTSGRMTRSKEIRDELLSHYGFKVIHVDYNTFKAKDRITQDVVLMNKRLFPEREKR